MKCVVDNVQLDPGRLIYRDRGYGKDLGKLMSRFSLLIADDELLTAFSDPFEAFMLQCKEDDEKFFDIDIPELKSTGYPLLKEMLSSHRQLLAGLMRDFLYFQLLDALVGSNPRANWQFVINEIAEASDEKSGYLLRGTGYTL